MKPSQFASILFLVAIVGVGNAQQTGRVPAPASASRGHGTSDNAQTVTAAEARKVAQEMWSKVLTKCGDSYFYSGKDFMWQYKNVAFDILPDQLTQSDRMNGWEWRGFAIMNSLRYAGRGGNHPNEWFWMEGVPMQTAKAVTKTMSGELGFHANLADSANEITGISRIAMQKFKGEWIFKYHTIHGEESFALYAPNNNKKACSAFPKE